VYSVQVIVNWPVSVSVRRPLCNETLHRQPAGTSGNGMPARLGPAGLVDDDDNNHSIYAVMVMTLMTEANARQFNHNCRYTECLDCGDSCRRMQQKTTDFFNHSDQCCRPRPRTPDHRGRGREKTNVPTSEVKATTLLINISLNGYVQNQTSDQSDLLKLFKIKSAQDALHS